MSELYHHGIPGQKWGVKNGPPYPLASGKKPSPLRKFKRKLNIKDAQTIRENTKQVVENDTSEKKKDLEKNTKNMDAAYTALNNKRREKYEIWSKDEKFIEDAADYVKKYYKDALGEDKLSFIDVIEDYSQVPYAINRFMNSKFPKEYSNLIDASKKYNNSVREYTKSIVDSYSDVNEKLTKEGKKYVDNALRRDVKIFNSTFYDRYGRLADITDNEWTYDDDIQGKIMPDIVDKVTDRLISKYIKYETFYVRDKD